jgi:hypothetical protein
MGRRRESVFPKPNGMTESKEPVPTPPFRLGPWEVRRDEGLLVDGDRP